MPASEMMRFFFARRENPSRPLVRVSFQRRYFFFRRVTIEPLGSDADEAAMLVYMNLYEYPIEVPLYEPPLPGGARSLAPPHTRSAARVALAMRHLSRFPAFVTWAEGNPPPASSHAVAYDPIAIATRDVMTKTLDAAASACREKNAPAVVDLKCVLAQITSAEMLVQLESDLVEDLAGGKEVLPEATAHRFFLELLAATTSDAPICFRPLERIALTYIRTMRAP